MYAFSSQHSHAENLESWENVFYIDLAVPACSHVWIYKHFFFVFLVNNTFSERIHRFCASYNVRAISLWSVEQFNIDTLRRIESLVRVILSFLRDVVCFCSATKACIVMLNSLLLSSIGVLSNIKLFLCP